MERGESIESMLQRCLARLEAGEPLEVCLSDVPDHADELAPLLMAAAELRRWEPPALSGRARASARARALAALAEQDRAGAGWRAFLHGSGRLAMRFALALVVVFVLLGSGIGLARASLPGQLLYGLKRGSEQIRLDLAGASDQQVGLYLDFADRRLDEAIALLSDGQPLGPDLLDDLAFDYTMAWQAIAQADPALRPDLLARYRETVLAQRQSLALMLSHTSTPAVRADLARLIRVNDAAAGRFAPPPPTATATALPSATPSATATPAPTATRRPSPYPTATPQPTQAPSATPAPVVVPPRATAVPARRPPTAQPRPTDDHSGPNPTEDHSGPNPTDDHGGPSPTDDHSGPSPTDDHGGSNPTDDHSDPNPTDDHGGDHGSTNPTDDHDGDHGGTNPTDDHGGDHGGSGGDGS